MAEESRVSRHGDVTWLPIADIINLVSISASAFGVFVLPVAGYRFLMTAPRWFGFSVLLFTGHMVTLAAHYELFDIRHARSMKYFPRQERISTMLVGAAAVAYLIVVLT